MAPLDREFRGGHSNIGGRGVSFNRLRLEPQNRRLSSACKHRPHEAVYFLTEAQCPSLTASSSDYFQALQLVMYLAIMRSAGGSGNVPKAITHGTTDYQGLGSRWLTQNKPWLSFVVTHEASCCDSLIHEIYCAPCCKFSAAPRAGIIEIAARTV